MNARDDHGGTPLHYAVDKGHKEVVELLIAEGADVNAKIVSGTAKGITPLASARHPEIAELLIAKGADVNVKRSGGRTPLHEAPNKEITELLIAKGADVNAKGLWGWTPLHGVANKGVKQTAELLIEKGADECES